MDFATLSLIVAALAFCITGFGVVIEWKSIKISRGIQNWLMHESEARPTVIEELDEYLSEEFDVEGGGKISRLDFIGQKIGAAVFQGQRFSGMQAKSVNSRLENNFRDKILSAVQKEMPIGYQILFGICEKAGIPLDEVVEKKQLPSLIAAIKNNQLDALFAGMPLNNGSTNSSPGPGGMT